MSAMGPIASAAPRNRLVHLGLVRLGAVGEIMARWSPLLIAALFAAGVGIVLSRYPIGQNSDGLIQTLFGLQHMTLFFWAQDRFANLLPALTMWIADPATNAMAQLVLRVGLGMTAPLFLCTLATAGAGGGSGWRATLVASAALLAFAPQRTIYEAYIEASPYGTSFALAGLALLALRQSNGGHPVAWRATGLALTFAAYMVNASLVLVAVPLVVGEALLFGSALAMEFAAASLIAGLATFALSKLATDVVAATPLKFGESWVGLATYGAQMLGKPGRFVWGMAGFAAVSLAVMRRWPGNAGAAGHVGVLAACFVVGFCGVSLSNWVILNQMHPRYLVPSYFVAAALGGLALVCLLQGLRSAGARDAVLLGICTCLLVVAATRARPPKEMRGGTIVSAAFRADAEFIAAQVAARRLDGVVGGYFDVWPAVFAAEQMAHDAGAAPGAVFGVTLRGEVRQAEFNARLLRRGRLDFACIDVDPGRCNALLLATMRPSASVARFPGSLVALPDGRALTFFSIISKPTSP